MSHERESHRETAPDGQPAPARRPAAVPPIAAAGNAAIGRLLSGRGGGDPLPAGFRAEAEAGFGADFSGVRVHTDPDADRLARSVSARAVTTGDDIFFGRGRYQPEARSGRELIGHELAHVVQGSPGRSSELTDPRDPVERAAEAAGRRFAAGQPAGPVIAGQLSAVARAADDIRIQSITVQYATGLGDKELADQLGSVDQQLRTLPGTSAEYNAARENQSILQQEQIRRLVDGPGVSTATPAPTDDVSVRHAHFKQAVLLAAQHRLTQNQENLEQWRALIETQFSAPAFQTDVLAQSAADLQATARRTGAGGTFDQWAGDANPYRRNVEEHQIRGEWRACTGCHELVRADDLAKHESHLGPAWTAPADRLSQSAGMPAAAPGQTAGARVLAAVAAIRPIVAPLGDSGYRIIPDDVFSLGSGQTPEQLKTAILAKIAERQAGYLTLREHIAAGDMDYLQFGPILQDLLPSVDAQVRQAVADDQARAHTWAILKIGGTIVLALLSMLFPPLTLALAALQFAAGADLVKSGADYSRAKGADDVLSRQQQDAGPMMMTSGVLNMSMAAATIVAAAPAALDMAATRAITASDLAIAQKLAARAAQGPIPEAELLALQQPGLVGRMGQGWAGMRGYQVLYRGQGAPTAELVSPIARSSGLADSQAMYDMLKAEGMTDLEIAGYTARFNGQPVPGFALEQGQQHLANQPLGGVGIPTTRLPNVAADFAQGSEGVIYVLRVPKKMAIDAGPHGWPKMSELEQEFVIFHQIPNGMVVRTMGPGGVGPLKFDFAPPSGVGPSLVKP